MDLDSIVPWGRSFAEYCDMFSLDAGDLEKVILGCADGPSSFNSILSARGGSVTSIDPIYRFTRRELQDRINEAYEQIISQVEQVKDQYIWKNIASVKELGRIRMEAMEEFLSDYESGKAASRYLEGALPDLPFRDKSFDLALCSHFLFLYSDHFGMEEHVTSILELCRVAREVRIYPLVTLKGEESPHLNAVEDLLAESGHRCERVATNYEFQKGAKEKLMIRDRTDRGSV